ncbi:hypothetical protein AVEN_203485-1 [Araneus ventricosus]|uniref:Reverse transcriptase domain-containing protein n=1 Tax=Araneus ventricosus TaxID=182803 RepID=A0A4Y2BHA0_ARAVE|nr:hypothetical protein AVEN_203485-1 [Araneus ventricosus]
MSTTASTNFYAVSVYPRRLIWHAPGSGVAKIGNAPLWRTKSAAAGDSEGKSQNGYSATEVTSLVPRKQINCNSSKMFSPRVSKLLVSKSTEEAILDLLVKINSAKNSNQHALMISLDIKGAFDHLQYTSIKNSLDNLKYHSNTLETLIDIPSNRKVATNTSQGPATWNQQQGCPQGSCTGQAFWNLKADEVLR